MLSSATHDHQHCIASALAKAEALCESKGVRLTKIRRRVLELVWESHKPAGAYDLLELLAKEGFNSAPPTIYRALDFLLDLGLIHRISSLNAYIGCQHPDHTHPTGFFICNQCGNASELPPQALIEFAAAMEDQLQITIEQQSCELSGICKICQEAL